MNTKVKMLLVSLLCLNLVGCEYVDNILHPDDGDEIVIDENFKNDALQLGLSEAIITQLCTATKEISVKCISVLSSESNQQEVRFEYSYNNVTQENDYAKSTDASRIIFHLPVDSTAARIEFENNRSYQFNDGYEYTWVEPTDIETADVVNDADESLAKLVNSAVIKRVTSSKLTNVSTASLSNDKYSITEAQDLVNRASTVLFPVLAVSVTSSDQTVPIDASFKMFTTGHNAILSNFSTAFSTAIEQSWI
ncbi:hypothetical protein swp_4378 [Shewanella piezotolerans WP3]|uniref:Uncharacterized protein n=1 Tax=Shewanella piezotolerans (strain WP3 / JCM 13877) TaxID=225849 RepID=B8CTB4_SHEPW|nr:hypothetical protein [Shewanella piezotolerans]ACJ31023.1 hypothetical protein swp_4378 [Shewanella piezotolerans WP3]